MKNKNILLWIFVLTSCISAQELISDQHFQRGFQVLAPSHPPMVEGIIVFDTTQTPIWTCGQWGSRSSLINIESVILQNSWYHWTNTEKEVHLGPDGIEEYDILLGVNSQNEYGGIYRQLGESWPHLLVEQRLSPPNTAGPGSPSLDSLTNLDFHVEVKLENDSTIIQAGYDANNHAAQFLIYFTIQNLNTNSPGYGNEFIWLGVQVYDDRYEKPAKYVNHDDGTQTLIYSIAYDNVASKSVHSNEWISFDVNLFPYAIKALGEAWQRGYLSSSKDLADYKVGGMNMGWELPGMNIGQMKIRNLSLVASNSPTDIQNKLNNKLGFSLSQNYPNPFNSSTKIKYSIPVVDVNFASTTNVKLIIYDVLGKKIKTLVNKEQQSGNYEIVFNANELPTGIYFYKIVAGKFLEIKKLLVLK